mgnify:CR=1 FL=1|jgi:hypothetical protein
MAKTLTVTCEGKDYILEFNRRTVAEMERNGFIAADVSKKPMSTLPVMFEGAFLAHHRFTPKETIAKMFDSMPNKSDLIGKLSEMYNEPILSLLTDSEEPEGNVNWTASW